LLKGGININIKWKGNIDINGIAAYVEVTYRTEVFSGLAVWSGSGKTQSYELVSMLLSKNPFNTSIGKIVITDNLPNSNGATFRFKGTGDPIGDLLAKINE